MEFINSSGKTRQKLELIRLQPRCKRSSLYLWSLNFEKYQNKSIAAFSNNQDSDSRNKINHIQFKESTEYKNIQMETSKQEIKSVIIEKFVKTNGSSLAFSKYQNSNAKTKIIDFSIQISFNFKKMLIGTLMKDV